MIGLYRFFGCDLVIHDPAKHFDESEWMLGEIDLSPEQRNARTILLRVRDQLEGVIRCASASAEDADDQLGIVARQFIERFRTVVSNL